jgi:hypothetical protein
MNRNQGLKKINNHIKKMVSRVKRRSMTRREKSSSQMMEMDTAMKYKRANKKMRIMALRKSFMMKMETK